LGIGVNGQVTSAGTLEFSTVLPWRNAPIRDFARSCFSMPTFVTGHHHGALAEYRYGAGQGSRCMLYFNVADGVSACAIVNGEMFTGGTGSAGQIGHIVIQPGGRLCGCGQRGCLEALISGPAICYRIAEDAKSRSLAKADFPPSLVAAARNHAAVATMNELVRRAHSGKCRDAQTLLSQIIELAGQGLAMAMACYAPDLIIIDGYMFRDRPDLIQRLVDAARCRLGSHVARLPLVVSGKLGDAARLMSLVAVVADELVQSGAIDG
jgi:glucokinase